MSYLVSQIEHKYGENVVLVSDPFLNSLLVQLCHPKTVQPTVNHLIERLYSALMVIAMNRELRKKEISIETRMTAMHPDQKYQGTVIDEAQRAISVGLARAGTFPSHLCYQLLNQTLEPSGVRQDHFWAARTTDMNDKVTGAAIATPKIGGDVDGATVFLPDPMGATGSTIDAVLKLYKEQIRGKAAAYVALHLIVTPEYIRNLKKSQPDLKIYALRLDRGLSPADVLKTPPGTHIDRERGLNDKQYIVPGAGGLGEVLNNSFC